MNWIALSLLSAVCAGFTAVFAKLSLTSFEPTTATIIRSFIMLITLVMIKAVSDGFNGTPWAQIESKAWLFLIISGIAGALSWCFYLVALKHGPTAQVSALDRTSLIFVIILSVVILGEKVSMSTLLGSGFILAGAYLVILS